MGLLHRVEQSLDRVAESGLAIFRICEDVAGLVLHRDMHMHSVAGPFNEGLGHEGGLEIVLSRNAGNEPAQQHCIIGGQKRIASVMQVELELAGSRFRDGRIGGYALCVGGTAQLVHDAHERLQVGQGVHVLACRAEMGGEYRRRGARPVTVVLILEEIEFEFEGRRGAQPCSASLLRIRAST